jgi:hypothetical protein
LEMTKISAEEPNVPRKMRERYEAIIGITDEFCHEHLNEEYADLSRKMAATLVSISIRDRMPKGMRLANNSNAQV